MYAISYDWSSELDDLFGRQPRAPNTDAGDGWSSTEQSDADQLATALLQRKPSVSFCLLSGMVGGASDEPQDRVRPMFVCVFSTWTGARALAMTLSHGHPLSSNTLLQALTEEATFLLHNDLILALAITTENVTARSGRTAAAAKYDPNEDQLRPPLSVTAPAAPV